MVHPKKSLGAKKLIIDDDLEGNRWVWKKEAYTPTEERVILAYVLELMVLATFKDHF